MTKTERVSIRRNLTPPKEKASKETQNLSKLQVLYQKQELRRAAALHKMHF